MMEKTQIRVDGMSCEHCVKAITKAVNGLSGVGGVDVDLKNKTVTEVSDPAQISLDKIKAEKEDQGSDVIA